MYRLIGEKNRVNYGCIDEPIDFNYRDFRLNGFFDKEIRGLRKRFALHAFNYLGIITDDFLVGMAAVNLGYMQIVFAYLYHYKNGKLFEFNRMFPGNRSVDFPVNPDEYIINFSKRGSKLRITKSHAHKLLSIDADLGRRFSVTGTFPYGIASHTPLRVLNPTDPTRWTFTEKCAPIQPTTLSIRLDGAPLSLDLSRAALIYDWSGGYMRRDSNWYWAACAGVTKGRKPRRIGINLAALTNESYHSENAFWTDGKRTRISRSIFDFDPTDPLQPWYIHDDEGKADLVFSPLGVHTERINAFFVKSNFRQFIGTFSGTLRPSKGKAVTFDRIYGFTELHRSRW
jgi:hypothetical protein